MLDELAQLIDSSIAAYTYDPGGVDGNVFVHTMPQTPDRVLALFRYGGPEADTRTGWDMPNIQARARGSADPRQAEADAQAVYDLLHGWAGTLPGGTVVVGIIGVQSGPVWLAQDANNRHEFVVNFRTEGVRNTARPEA